MNVLHATLVAVLLVLSSPALAEEGPPAGEAATETEVLLEEVRALREEVRRLETEVRTPSPAEAPPSAPPADQVPSDQVTADRVHMGTPVHIAAGEVVADAVSFGGGILVDGHVRGDAVSFGGDLRVRDGGIVDGDAVSIGGRIHLEPGGVLRGDRVNIGASALALAGRGEVESWWSSFWSGLYNKLVFLLSFAGAGVLVVGVFPDRVARVAAAIEARPGRAALLGGISVLGGLIGTLLFAITLIGIPLALVLVALLALAWLLGFVGLCQAVGDRLPMQQKVHGRWIAFLGGVLLVGFLGVLPFVGWIAFLGISLIGIGGAFATRFGSA